MKNKKKTHSGSKKRFKLTATGKIKRSHTGASHLMSKKTPKQLRKLRKNGIVSEQDQKRIEGALGK